jgi:hypothetical protein
MPYYALGSLSSYPWKKNQILEFKNVLKQICFAMCIAFDTVGFVHMDLHAGNVLLRVTKKKELNYGEGANEVRLPLLGKYAMIMDLQRYCLNDAMRFVESLERLIYTACVSDASDVMFDAAHHHVIRSWYRRHSTPPLSAQAFNELGEIIDTIPVRYVKSEVPIVKW